LLFHSTARKKAAVQIAERVEPVKQGGTLTYFLAASRATLDIHSVPDEDKTPTHPQENPPHLHKVHSPCCSWSHDDGNWCLFMSTAATEKASASLAYLANIHIKQL